MSRKRCRSTVLGALLTALVAAGCWAPDPPQYQSPKQTPPVLDLGGAAPGVTEIIDRAMGGGGIDFSIGVRSEDAGQFLVGSVFLNYGSDREEHITDLLRKPSVFADTSRSITFSFNRFRPGCHVLVLLVTHVANYDEIAKKPRDFSDVALATWWLHVRDEPEGDPPACTDFGGA